MMKGGKGMKKKMKIKEERNMKMKHIGMILQQHKN